VTGKNAKISRIGVEEKNAKTSRRGAEAQGC